VNEPNERDFGARFEAAATDELTNRANSEADETSKGRRRRRRIRTPVRRLVDI